MSFYLQDASQSTSKSLAGRENLIIIGTNRFGVLQGDVQIR